MAAPATSAARPASPSATNTRVLGGLLLVFGSAWLAKQTGVVDMPWSAVTSLVLVALGLAMVATARSKARTVPLMLVGIALTAGLAVGSSNIDIKGGIGDQTFAPHSLVTNPRPYHLGIGDMTIDLRTTALREGTTTLKADVGIGRVVVRVPDGVAMRIDVDAKWGNAEVFGDKLGVHGHGRDSSTTEGYDKATQRLHLILRVGMGQIEVTR
jgi:predicted membrane protein